MGSCRFSRIFALAVVGGLLLGADADAADSSALGLLSSRECADLLAAKDTREIVRVHAALVETQLAKIPENETSARIREAVALKKRASATFPEAEFLEYASEANVAAARKRLGGEATLAKLLDELHAGFLVEYEPKRLKAQAELVATIGSLNDIPRETLRECKTWSCIRADLKAMPSRVAERLRLTCLAKNPAALSATVKDLAFTWSGYIVAHARKKNAKITDFPFEYVLTGAVWSPIVSEVGCRKEFVKPETAGQVRKAAWKVVGGKIWNYARWYPASAATAVAAGYGADRLRGRKSDEENLLMRFGYYILYDAIIGPIRRVLVSDPLFLRFFPAARLALVPKLGGNLTTAILGGADLGARFGIGWGKAELRGAVDARYFAFEKWLASQDGKSLSAVDPLPLDGVGSPLRKEDLEEAALALDENGRTDGGGPTPPGFDRAAASRRGSGG